MILFFKTQSKSVIATEADHKLSEGEISELSWLYGEAKPLAEQQLSGYFVGPRREMITPWSTNAVEITQNMGINGILRIEEYFPVSSKDADYDPMLQRLYDGLDQSVFTVNHSPEPIKHVKDLEKFNEEEGLALSPEEMEYLHKIEKPMGALSPTPRYSDLHKSTLSIAVIRFLAEHSLLTERKKKVPYSTLSRKQPRNIPEKFSLPIRITLPLLKGL